MNDRTRCLARHGSRVLGTSLIFAFATTWLFAVPMASGRKPPDARDFDITTTTTADLVVDYGDGRVAVRRVPLPEGALSGLEVLSRAGIALASNNGAVCAIGGQGCPASDCFCACRGAASCRFWSYNHGRPDGSWENATTGPMQHTVLPGSVEGWVWGGSRPPLTAPAELRSALLGESWLAGRRRPNGSQGDHVGLTAEGVLAARSVGSPIDPYLPFLVAQADDYSKQGAAQAGKLAVAVAAADGDPRDFGGVDLVRRISGTFEASTGQFGASVWDQSWAVLGLAASGETVPQEAARRLAAAEAMGGGWSGNPGGAEADADSTGLALQALVAPQSALTVTNDVRARGQGWLRSQQNEDGGWGHGGGSNVNSTAYAVQGVMALGGDPRDENILRRDPLAFLLDQQRPDGHFQYDQSPGDLVATLQTVPAVAGRPANQIRSRAVASRKAVDLIRSWQGVDGSFGGTVELTVEAVVALAANGHVVELSRSQTGGRSAISYLESHAATFAAEGAAAAGGLTVAAVALGKNPRSFGGADLVRALLRAYDPATGAFTGTLWVGFVSPAKQQSWGILGLAAAREPIPPLAVTRLISLSEPSGGWRVNEAFRGAEAETTGLALQALAAAGVPSDNPVVIRSIEALFLLRWPGGWAHSATDWPNTPRNAAHAIEGLIASGQKVDGPGWRTWDGIQSRGDSPWDDLLRLQSPTGGFNGQGVSGSDNPFDTCSAALALAGHPLPLPPPPRLYLPRASRGK